MKVSRMFWLFGGIVVLLLLPGKSLAQERREITAEQQVQADHLRALSHDEAVKVYLRRTQVKERIPQELPPGVSPEDVNAFYEIVSQTLEDFREFSEQAAEEIEKSAAQIFENITKQALPSSPSLPSSGILPAPAPSDAAAKSKPSGLEDDKEGERQAVTVSPAT